jgi:hypothetical protein
VCVAYSCWQAQEWSAIGRGRQGEGDEEEEFAGHCHVDVAIVNCQILSIVD